MGYKIDKYSSDVGFQRHVYEKPSREGELAVRSEGRGHEDRVQHSEQGGQVVLGEGRETDGTGCGICQSIGRGGARLVR